MFKFWHHNGFCARILIGWFIMLKVRITITTLKSNRIKSIWWFLIIRWQRPYCRNIMVHSVYLQLKGKIKVKLKLWDVVRWWSFWTGEFRLTVFVQKPHRDPASTSTDQWLFGFTSTFMPVVVNIQSSIYSYPTLYVLISRIFCLYEPVITTCGDAPFRVFCLNSNLSIWWRFYSHTDFGTVIYFLYPFWIKLSDIIFWGAEGTSYYM